MSDDAKPPLDAADCCDSRWVIVGAHGLYTGQWMTRKSAIATHCAEIGRDWKTCKNHGDRAVKAIICWKNAPSKLHQQDDHP